MRLCPECGTNLVDKKSCVCGWEERRKSNSGFWATCQHCKIALPPYSQVQNRQALGEPVAHGHLCGPHGRQYYLCTACLKERRYA